MFSFKNLLRVITSLLFIAMVTLPAFAQNNYIKIGSAYNSGIGSTIQAAQVSGNIKPNGSAQLTHKQVKVNFGEGFSFQGAIGRYFTKNFGFELGYVTLRGKTHKIESRYYHTDFAITESYDQTYKAKLSMLQPAIIFRMEPKTFTPYGKMGISLARLSATEHHKNSLWTQSWETDGEFSGGFGFGFHGAVGVDIAANKNLTFFLEGNFSNLSWAPNRWERTSYKENGKSAPEKVPGNEWEIAFSETYVADYDNNGSRIYPKYGLRKELKQDLPVNTAGLAMGIKITF